VTFPAFFTAKFQLPEGEEPRDTFLDMSNWGKVLLKTVFFFFFQIYSNKM
jgi:hypothetical protein